MPKPVKFAPKSPKPGQPAAVKFADTSFDFGFNKPRKAKKPKAGGAAGSGS